MVIKHGRYGSALAEKQALWAPAYARRLSNFGSTALLVPMGDENHENSGRTTVTTIGDEQVVFTYSQGQAVTDFDNPPHFEGPGHVPVINFNQSDEWLETPDAAFWNDSAGTSEPSYYWSAWGFVVEGVSNQTLWSKSAASGTAGTDWIVFAGATERVMLRIFDDSANAYIGQIVDVSAPAGWHHLAITKHDDSALSSSVIIYLDGGVRASGVSEAGTYVQQEDGTNVVRIGAQTDGGDPLAFSLAGGPLGPMFIPVGAGTVPTADQILADYQLGREMLGL